MASVQMSLPQGGQRKARCWARAGAPAGSVLPTPSHDQREEGEGFAARQGQGGVCTGERPRGRAPGVRNDTSIFKKGHLAGCCPREEQPCMTPTLMNKLDSIKTFPSVARRRLINDSAPRRAGRQGPTEQLLSLRVGAGVTVRVAFASCQHHSQGVKPLRTANHLLPVTDPVEC